LRQGSDGALLTRTIRRIVSLPSQLLPVFQPLSDLALETALGRIIEFLPLELFGKIVLTGKSLGRVMVSP
jgi:hypothetical protein